MYLFTKFLFDCPGCKGKTCSCNIGMRFETYEKYYVLLSTRWRGRGRIKQYADTSIKFISFITADDMSTKPCNIWRARSISTIFFFSELSWSSYETIRLVEVSCLVKTTAGGALHGGSKTIKQRARSFPSPISLEELYRPQRREGGGGLRPPICPPLAP